MLVFPSGKDAFTNILENESDKLASTVRRVPGPVRKAISVGAIPAAAVGGFLLTPSRRAIAGVVGGAVSGIIGGIGKDRLDSATATAAKPALAQLFLDIGIDGAGIAEAVQDVKKQFNVGEEEFEVICADVYKQYLVCMCNDPNTKMSDISELAKLRSALGLGNLALGQAHAEGAMDIYRIKATWTPTEELADPEHPDRMSMDKFLFLTERSLRAVGETDEALTFEMSRVSKSFGLSMKVIEARIKAIAEPFYQRALTSTRTKLESGAVSAEMLKKARNQLGINEWSTRDMHISCFSDEVRSLLGVDKAEYDSSKCAFPEGALDRLNSLKDVLELSDDDAKYEIEHEVTPLFQTTATAAFEEAMADASKAEAVWDQISARQAELGLSDETSASMIGSAAVQAVGGILEEAVQFAKVNNGAKTLEFVNKALDTKESVVTMLSASEKNDEASIEKFFDSDSENSATGFIPYTDRSKIYAVYFNQSLKTSKGGKTLTEEQEGKLAELRALLGIDDEIAFTTIKNTCGPIVKETLIEASKDVLGPEYDSDLVVSLKKENQKLIDNLKLPAEIVEEYSHACYVDGLKLVQQNTPGGIPSKDYVDKLAALRDLLDIDMENVRSDHLDTFGPSYKKSVIEAMGVTGVIRPEFRAALEKLRNGLGVSEDDAEGLFLEAVAEKMKPMVKALVNEMERTLLTTEQLSQKRGIDMGEDVFKGGKGAQGKLGIGAAGNLIGDCMNLVDFYTENDIGKKQTGTKTVEKKISSEDGETTEEVEEPMFEQSYPVTALEIGGCDEESAEALYRQFLVTIFTEQGPNVARYEAAAPTFGYILGFDEEKQEEVGGNIGSMIYENYVNNVMRTKPSLDQQDMMFLANIQTKLNLSSEKSEELLVAAQKKNLQEEATRVFANLSSSSGALIKSFRERCNSMGIDLKEDLEMTSERLKGMFTVEILEGIENGSISPESGDLLSEIQESLCLTAEECESALEVLVTKCAEGTLSAIGTEFRRGRDERAAEEIKKLIRYATFVDGELELDVSEEMAQRICGVFDAVDTSEEDPEKVQQERETLRTALGI